MAGDFGNAIWLPTSCLILCTGEEHSHLFRLTNVENMRKNILSPEGNSRLRGMVSSRKKTNHVCEIT
jgi:hypothetical protein